MGNDLVTDDERLEGPQHLRVLKTVVLTLERHSLQRWRAALDPHGAFKREALRGLRLYVRAQLWLGALQAMFPDVEPHTDMRVWTRAVQARELELGFGVCDVREGFEAAHAALDTWMRTTRLSAEDQRKLRPVLWYLVESAGRMLHAGAAPEDSILMPFAAAALEDPTFAVRTLRRWAKGFALLPDPESPDFEKANLALSNAVLAVDRARQRGEVRVGSRWVKRRGRKAKVIPAEVLPLPDFFRRLRRAVFKTPDDEAFSEATLRNRRAARERMRLRRGGGQLPAGKAPPPIEAVGVREGAPLAHVPSAVRELLDKEEDRGGKWRRAAKCAAAWLEALLSGQRLPRSHSVAAFARRHPAVPVRVLRRAVRALECRVKAMLPKLALDAAKAREDQA